MNKLDLYKDEGRPHIAMTGAFYRGHSVVVDAREIVPNNWVFGISYYNHIMEIIRNQYDDIAVMEDYIVVTSHSLQDGKAYAHMYAKPISYTSFLSGYVSVDPLCFNTVSSVLLEHCVANKYSYLAKMDSCRFIVGFNDWLNYVSAYVGLRESFMCCDIKFNLNSLSDVDVLLKGKDNNGNVWSEIITPFPMQSSGNKPIVVDAHRYNGHDIRSLDYLFSLDNIIASGQMENRNQLYVYRCHRPEWYCKDQIVFFATRWRQVGTIWEYVSYPMLIEIGAQQLECSYEYTNVSTFCERNK